jgi:hypothetical protein
MAIVDYLVSSQNNYQPLLRFGEELSLLSRKELQRRFGKDANNVPCQTIFHRVLRRPGGVKAETIIERSLKKYLYWQSQQSSADARSAVGNSKDGPDIAKDAPLWLVERIYYKRPSSEESRHIRQ